MLQVVPASLLETLHVRSRPVCRKEVGVRPYVLRTLGSHNMERIMYGVRKWLSSGNRQPPDGTPTFLFRFEHLQAISPIIQ